MTEEIKALAQAFGSGAIGLVALLIFAQQTRKNLQEMFSIVRQTLEILAQEQEYQERLYQVAEDKGTTTTLLLKSLEMCNQYGRGRPQHDDAQRNSTG